MALYASSSIPRMLARSSAGEHYLDTVGVAGSIPVEPTILCPLPFASGEFLACTPVFSVGVSRFLSVSRETFHEVFWTLLISGAMCSSTWQTRK